MKKNISEIIRLISTKRKKKQKKKLGQILRNFRLHMRTPFYRADIAQLSVGHALTQGKTEWVKWPSVTSGSHVTCTSAVVRNKRGKKAGMRRTYFRSLPVTSFPVVSPCTTSSSAVLSVLLMYKYVYFSLTCSYLFWLFIYCCSLTTNVSVHLCLLDVQLFILTNYCCCLTTIV